MGWQYTGWWSVLVCGLVGGAAAAADRGPIGLVETVLDDCESMQASRTIWTFQDVAASRSDRHATSGKSCLKLEFPAGKGLVQLNMPVKPLDWSRYKALSFDVFNAGEQVVELTPRIDDAWSQGFRDRFEPCDQIYLRPGKTTHLQIDLDDLQANNFRLLDTARITHVSFRPASGDGPRVLYVDSFHLLPLPVEDLARIVPDAVEPRLIDGGQSVEKSRSHWQASDAAVEAIATDAVPAELHARSALKVTFPANQASGMKIDCKAGPMDWRGYKTLCFEAFNPGNKPLMVGLRVDDAGTVAGERLGRFEVNDLPLPPGKKLVQVDIWRMVNLAGRKMDKSKIVLLVIYTAAAPRKQVLYVGNLRLGVEAGGLRNELRPGRIPGETPATLGKRLLEDPEIRPLIPVFRAMGPHKMAICSHSASISTHWSTSGSFFDVAAEAVRAVNPAVEYRGFHAGGMGASTAVAKFLKAMQDYRPTDTYLLVVPDRTLADERKLIDDMRAAGSRVFVFDAVKPWGAYSPAQQQALGRLCKERGATFIELMTRGYGAPRSYKWTTTDTIHMTTEGHLFYARELLKEWAKIYTPAARADAPVPRAELLWDPNVPEVHRNDLAEPPGLRRVTVHAAVQGEFQFVSGPCIVEHKGRLFARHVRGQTGTISTARLPGRRVMLAFMPNRIDSHIYAHIRMILDMAAIALTPNWNTGGPTTATPTVRSRTSNNERIFLQSNPIVKH